MIFGNYKIKRIFKETIEPEEILLDAVKSPELENQRIEVPIRPKIFKVFFLSIILVFAVLLSYSGYLEIAKGQYYRDLAEHNRTHTFLIVAPRGIIYDRNLSQLVYNIPSFDLVLNKSDLPYSPEEQQAVIVKVAQIVGKKEQEISDILKTADSKLSANILVVENLNHEQLLLFEQKIEQLPGFRIEKNIVRQYVDAPYFSHILGYLGKLGSEDIEKNQDYFLTEKIGKNGLEYFYEKILRGQPGKLLIETDSRGKQKRELAQIPSQGGQSLQLNIDSGLQKKLYESLEKVLARLHLKKATALALNPQTGGILAMVSFPSFDNNLFAKGISPNGYAALLNDNAQPLFNRAISGQYSPGSTVKPLIGAAALQEKIISPATKIYDSGELVLVNQYNPGIIYRFADWKAHGIVDIYSAIAESCDVYFYTIGGGYGNIKGLGVENLEKFFKFFGFGKKLGIDLSGEAVGLVPNPQWKEKTKNEQWYTGDTYHISIGQGDLLVTPLQLAAATAAIVNGGKIIQPHLVDKIIDSDKNIVESVKLKILEENFIKSDYLEIIKKGMRQAVTDGSASLLADLEIPVGAKTGTAQVTGQNNSNAWATVFAPYDNPEMVLVVLVENAGEGSQVAVPVAKEVLESYFSNKK